MEKIKIKLLILGSSHYLFSLKKILMHRSSLYKIIDTSHVLNLPEPKHIAQYLNQEYHDFQLNEITGQDVDGIIRIGIIYCDLENNFYIRRISSRTAILSIKNPLEILHGLDISIENFILVNIYKIVTIAIESGYQLDKTDVISLFHSDTRRCLFDLNGDINTIKYNTERPIICSACYDRLNRKNIPIYFSKLLIKELSRINKNKIRSIELFIKKYPLLSIILTIILGIIINIISNIIIK